MASVERQPLHTRDSQTQRRRSTGVNLGRFLAERCSTPTWWRRARFSMESMRKAVRIAGVLVLTILGILVAATPFVRSGRKNNPPPERINMGVRRVDGAHVAGGTHVCPAWNGGSQLVWKR